MLATANASLDNRPVQMISGARSPIGIFDVGTGEPVLVLHGFPDHAPGMMTVADAIAASGRRAIVPALPGYLPSRMPPDGDVTVGAVALDLLAILDALRVERFSVVGHDWGALLAYQLGAEHAPRVERVVGLSAPHPTGFRVRRRVLREQQTAVYAWLLAYARTGAELPSDPAWLTQVQQYWSPGLQRADWDEVLQLLAQPEVAAAVCRWYRCDFDNDAALGDVLVPAMVIHGAQDGCIGPAVFLGTDERFARGVRRVTLPEIGHWPHLEAPGAVLPLIIQGLETTA
jgi:pimeloyl-ACP methyl ester carboxylesterase